MKNNKVIASTEWVCDECGNTEVTTAEEARQGRIAFTPDTEKPIGWIEIPNGSVFSSLECLESWIKRDANVQLLVDGSNEHG